MLCFDLHYQQRRYLGKRLQLSLPLSIIPDNGDLVDFHQDFPDFQTPGVVSYLNDKKMQPLTIKQFSVDEVDLILLRLKLSNIESEFWLDMDGFFNYNFSSSSTTLALPKKSPEINWTRIDEVISQMAYDAALIYPESLFGAWYKDQQASNDFGIVNQESLSATKA
jgi:hypothetical protein